MRTLMLILGLMTAAAHATESGRFQAIALEGESGVRSGAARVMIVDTVEGHVWTWSGNELLPDASGSRRYGAAFVYQGRLRPGSKPGEVIDSQPR